MAHLQVLRRLAAAAAIGMGAALPAHAVPGPHAVTDVSQALVRAYNAQDPAALHALLAPALQARYGLEALERALLLCRVLTSEIFRISTPVWGARHFGYFAVYAETKPFEMILEIDDDARIIHWVITDDVQAKAQQCQLSYRE
ncbi:MAG TPA: hypothetical protein VHL98_02800 [Microvirga sp.]|jgi:hypothetical protein|nr:hypothetical protein [Microvirga sp.]